MKIKVAAFCGIVAGLVAFAANLSSLTRPFFADSEKAAPPAYRDTQPSTEANQVRSAYLVDLTELQIQVIYTVKRRKAALAIVRKLRGHGAVVRTRQEDHISAENDGGLFYVSHERRGHADEVANVVSELAKLDVQFYSRVIHPVELLIYVGERTQIDGADERTSTPSKFEGASKLTVLRDDELDLDSTAAPGRKSVVDKPDVPKPTPSMARIEPPEFSKQIRNAALKSEGAAIVNIGLTGSDAAAVSADHLVDGDPDTAWKFRRQLLPFSSELQLSGGGGWQVETVEFNIQKTSPQANLNSLTISGKSSKNGEWLREATYTLDRVGSRFKIEPEFKEPVDRIRITFNSNWNFYHSVYVGDIDVFGVQAH